MVTTNWEPGNDYGIRLSDETGDSRTEEELTGMVEQIQNVANMYGFDLSATGGWSSFVKMMAGEDAFTQNLNQKVGNLDQMTTEEPHE